MELPPREQAESVRLVLKSAELFNCEEGGQQGLEAAPPPLVVNLMKVANVAKLEEVPDKTWCGLVEAMGAEAAQSVQPAHMVELLTELGTNDREQLSGLLVESNLVPKEHERALTDIVRPGGFADKLQTGLAWVAVIRRCLPALIALPALELWLAYGLLAHGGLLMVWLRLDTWLTVVLSIVAAFAFLAVNQILHFLKDDPVGAFRRGWSNGGSFKAKVQAALPGMPLVACKKALLGVAGVATLACCSLAWAAFGLLLLPVALLCGCSLGTFLISALVISLRASCVAPMGYVYVRKHLFGH